MLWHEGQDNYSQGSRRGRKRMGLKANTEFGLEQRKRQSSPNESLFLSFLLAYIHALYLFVQCATK